MLNFFSENLGTVLVGLPLLFIIIAIAKKTVRDLRSGKSPGCDCSCTSCPNSRACHAENTEGQGL